MEKTQASHLYKIYEQALATLVEAEPLFRNIEQESERKAFMYAHANVVMTLLADLRGPLVRQYPELDASEPLDQSESVLSSEQQEAVDLLTSVQISQIDRALLALCTSDWRKVAFIVGAVLAQLDREFPGIPDAFYAQRIALLVSDGHIESQGNLDFMRYSEVRLRS